MENTSETKKTLKLKILIHEVLRRYQNAESNSNTFLLGFNDNIYHEGNIFKMPDFDVFPLLEIRKRKARSHGIRKKRNWQT